MQGRATVAPTRSIDASVSSALVTDAQDGSGSKLTTPRPRNSKNRRLAITAAQHRVTPADFAACLIEPVVVSIAPTRAASTSPHARRADPAGRPVACTALAKFPAIEPRPSPELQHQPALLTDLQTKHNAVTTTRPPQPLTSRVLRRPRESNQHAGR
jgi:hypothetical protein